MESPGKEEPDVEAVSPCKRWYRYAKPGGGAAGLVAKGSFKEVYKGFDREFGREVAWNVVNTEHSNRVDQGEIDRLEREFHLMKNLVNPNIVRCYGGWRDEKTGEINFITELFTSDTRKSMRQGGRRAETGSLRSYRWKHKDLDVEKAVNGWGRNILNGLAYLHSQTPPIVHRDLRCEYCYVNGNTGQVKIADLGRAKFLLNNTQPAMTVQNNGSTGMMRAEYIAPELYDDTNKYSTAVDIYSFGLLVLELCTLRRPYDELKSPADVFRAVNAGVLPEALRDVKDKNIEAIIKACLMLDPAARPTALELLQLDLFREIAPDEAISVMGSATEENRHVLKLVLTISRPCVPRLRFEFHLDLLCDTAKSITTEMMDQLGLSDEEAAVVAGKISNVIAKHSTEDNSSNEMKLVRIPSKHYDATAMAPALAEVVVTRDAADNSVLQVGFSSLSDRRNLLFNVVRTLRDFPLEVLGAVYSTEAGAVLEDLRLRERPGERVSIEELELALAEALNNEPPSPIQPPRQPVE